MLRFPAAALAQPIPEKEFRHRVAMFAGEVGQAINTMSLDDLDDVIITSATIYDHLEFDGIVWRNVQKMILLGDPIWAGSALVTTGTIAASAFFSINSASGPNPMSLSGDLNFTTWYNGVQTTLFLDRTVNRSYVGTQTDHYFAVITNNIPRLIFTGGTMEGTLPTTLDSTLLVKDDATVQGQVFAYNEASESLQLFGSLQDGDLLFRNAGKIEGISVEDLALELAGEESFTSTWSTRSAWGGPSSWDATLTFNAWSD